LQYKHTLTHSPTHTHTRTLFFPKTKYSNHGARVVVARDTRPSGPGLAAVLDAGVSLCAGSVVDLGELTTPQLHWVVSALNTHDSGLSAVVTGASEIGYYGAVADAFAALVAGTEASDAACAAPWPPALSIDAANGVGGMAAHRLAAVLGPRLCEVAVRNDGSAPADVLNEGCGSDHVKSGQCAPKGVELPAGSARLFASFDGDADRVVCYRRAADGAFRLLDGDKILTLFAVFVIKMLKAAGIREFVKVLCVQTAYANGASTAYLRDTLAVETDFTATGVKNLHHRALECDGVSVYFEANGHGTVLFGQGFRRALLLANPALDDA
jgi:phosphoacetylglucosamine mutase